MDEAQARNRPGACAGEFVCLSVRDTGCGMTRKVMAHIFEPFYTTKAPGKGTGLGLATVYGIVKQHEGWIEVESEAGAGTTFKLLLPALRSAADTPTPTVTDDRRTGGSETILLVEDEPAVRSLAKMILERLGYRVWEAGSGVSASDVWKEHADEIDLLLTDMVMPDGLTGRDLAQQLEAQRSDLKVLYSSGYSADLVAQRMIIQEGVNFLQKPYTVEKLAQAVRDCLDAGK
ncbi:MAG: response regulator [Limisphaerales bacterium]